MKKFKLYLLLAFAALIIPLTSCEHVGIGVEFGNGSNSYYEMTDYLCSRPWVDEWYDNNGTYYRQELNFYPDNVGNDYIFTQDRYGYIQESRYRYKRLFLYGKYINRRKPAKLPARRRTRVF